MHEAKRLVLVSWDGAGDWIVDRLLEAGELPHVARLARDGARAEYSASSFPSKTAAAHAALWTGCWAGCNGVADNRVLKPDGGSLLEVRDGFSSQALTAEPLYLTAAKAGRRVAVLSATQSQPATPHLEALRRAGVDTADFFSFDCFDQKIADGMLHTAADFDGIGKAWKVGETAFTAELLDDPSDATAGFDTLLIRRQDGLELRLKPRAAANFEPADVAAGGPDWSAAVAVGRGALEGNTFFRLFTLAPDGSALALYQREAWDMGGATGPEDVKAGYRRAFPGCYDEPYGLYNDGGFGPSVMAGGDGTAERRVLELAAFETHLLIRGSRFILGTWRPHVLIHYSPLTDGAGHSWMGVLDPARPGHDPEMAAVVWPYLRRVYAYLDAWLGALRHDAGPNAVVALVSDHGMAGVAREVFPNQILEDAGLLYRDGNGKIDLERTRILLTPASNFFLKVNDRERHGGPVSAAERATVLAAASKALLGVRDPRTGGPVVTRLIAAGDHPERELAFPLGGDLYLELAPGYYPRGGLGRGVTRATRETWGYGQHGYWPERRDMQAIFYAAGPGIDAGIELAPIRHIDVAPTLAHLVGIPAPAQASGRVLSLGAAEGQSPSQSQK